MAQKAFNLVPPLAGLDRKTSYKQRPPYSTPDCLNVRADDTIQFRTRLGSRPGLGRFFYEQLGSGNPIRMISECDVLKANDNIFWADWFTATSIDSIWETPSWIGHQPSILSDTGTLSVFDTEAGLIRTAISPFNSSTAYYIELFILPYDLQHNGKYRIYFNLDNSSPSLSTGNGVTCELTLEGDSGAYSGRIVEIQSGIGTGTSFTSGTNSSVLPGTFSVLVNGTNVKCYWRGTQLISHTLTGTYSGKRTGFSMYTTQADGACIVDGFRISYSENTYKENPRRVVAVSSNGILYSNATFQSQLSAVSTSLTLASDRNILASDRYQKLYIADYGDNVVKLTNGVVSGTSLDSSTISDWTALGLNTYDYVVVISSATGATVAGTYQMSTIASGNITLSSSPGDGIAVAFYIARCPKIYDPILGTLTKWTATSGKGQVPTGCYCICTYRDRLVLAGDIAWYMSKQGDPLDWDYSQTDAKRAVAGSSSEAGQIGQRIKAIINFGDDYLIFLCENSVWRLRGDPAYGGQLDKITGASGCVDKKSYCTTSENQLIWLSYDGLYLLESVSGSLPQQLSRNVIPKELINIDNKIYDVQLEFDFKFRGVHIYVTPKTGGNGKHFFFDLKNKAFWPVSIPSTMQPTSINACIFQDASQNAVLLGCRDGYVRYYNEKFEDDDGTGISSYVYYGPMQTWNDYKNGRIEELFCELGNGSGPVRYRLYGNDTPQNVLDDSSIFVSGAWPIQGLSYKSRPKMKCSYWALRLSNEENKRWAIENITATSEEAGTNRRL